MAGSRTLKLSILADVDDLKKKLDTGSDEVSGFAGKLEDFGKKAAAAFAVAAAAAAAYAGKLAIDGVKAAIEDEAAQQRLAKALQNTTGATQDQIKSVEDQIYKMELAYGVSDEKLRPAFQRLALATGDLGTSQKALQLALDISAATGKDLEEVSNSLGKAYEGNTGALTRLGVGLSTSDIKALGLDGTMNKLAETFGGAATTQANTLDGQMSRLKIRFEETKESIGMGLLPIVNNLFTYLNDRFIPLLVEAKNKALEPITKAFNDNKESMNTLYEFGVKYLVPFFETTLKKAIEGLGTTIGTIINIVGFVVSTIKTLANGVIDTINAIINGYNKIPILPDIPTISKPSILTGNSTGAIGNYSMSTGTTLGGSTTPTVATAATAIKTTSSSASSAPAVYTMPTFGGATGSAIGASSGFNPAGFRMGENAGLVINVNAPSIIDRESFARAVTEAFNESLDRGTGGAGGLRVNEVAL